MGFAPLHLSQLLPAIARVIIVVHTHQGALKALNVDKDHREEGNLLLSIGLCELLGKQVTIDPLQFNLDEESITLRLTVPPSAHNELTVPKLALREVYSEFELALHHLIEFAFDTPFEVRLCQTYFR